MNAVLANKVNIHFSYLIPQVHSKHMRVEMLLHMRNNSSDLIATSIHQSSYESKKLSRNNGKIICFNLIKTYKKWAKLM